MDIDYKAKSRFDASHAPIGVPGCRNGDGHTWHVSAGASGPLERVESGIFLVRGSGGLRTELLAVVAEINGRHLEDMMPGVLTTNEGIAAWLLERLPTAHEVTVETRTESATVHRRR